jgi:hypothetical protein
VIFHLGSWTVEWVIKALQTITFEHRDLRQITIGVSYLSTRLGIYENARRAIGETHHGQWLELDRLLIQFWESHSIRPKVVYLVREDMGDFAEYALPEITWRGILDLVVQ